jgi:outer membrane phospholipase A
MKNNQQIFEHTHAPSITNEVAKTLYPSLIGLIMTLVYKEKRKDILDTKLLSFYTEIMDILSTEHSNFYKFTDEEIEYKTSILSPIIKEMVISDESLHYEILVKNVGKLKELVSKFED